MAGARLDDLDLSIMDLLAEDGRMSTAEMARRLSASEPTVRRRLIRLLNERVVQVRAFPDPASMPSQLTTMIGLDIEPAAIDDVAQRLAMMRETGFVGIAVGGGPNIFFTVRANSVQAIHDFISETVAPIPGVQKVYVYLWVRFLKDERNMFWLVGRNGESASAPTLAIDENAADAR